MNYNQNQDLNQQFNQNQPEQFNNNQNAQNMYTPLNQQNQQQFPQYQQNQQQQQQQQSQQYQQQMVFHMEQPLMPNQNLQEALVQLSEKMINIFQVPKLVDPNATEAELQHELSLLKDNVQNIQKANLIVDIKNYLLKQNYKKEIPKNVNYCIKALGILKGSNSEIILKELKKKFDDDTDCLFSEAGTCFLGLTVCCCLCCFMLCLLKCCNQRGNCLPSNWQQIQEIKQLIDQSIAQCGQI